MWIRNKGTDAKPRFALVANRRIRGKKNPQQKVICYLGRHKTLDEAIQFWEFILKDLKKVLRNRNWHGKLAENSLLVKYAPQGDQSEILERLNKYKKLASRLRHHQKIKESGNGKRSVVRSFGETSQSLKLKFKIGKISKLINKIQRDGDDRIWNPSIKSSIKNLLQDIIDFYNRL
jgi:hypothetical protein